MPRQRTDSCSPIRYAPAKKTGAITELYQIVQAVPKASGRKYGKADGQAPYQRRLSVLSVYMFEGKLAAIFCALEKAAVLRRQRYAAWQSDENVSASRLTADFCVLPQPAQYYSVPLFCPIAGNDAKTASPPAAFRFCWLQFCSQIALGWWPEPGMPRQFSAVRIFTRHIVSG